MALLREAQSLQHQQRVPEAIAAYQLWLLRQPGHANSWFNLGLLLRQARRFGEAQGCYQRALDLGIADPEAVHLNRAVIYADYLRQDDAAERELNAALAGNANYIPALLNLANLHEDRGRRAPALALYRRALGIDAHCFEALARLANMSPDAECSPQLVSQLRSALAQPAAGDDDRATLGFALGRVLDARGEYHAAFAAYAAANRASRACAGPDLPRYDRRWQEQYTDRMMAAVSPVGARSLASVAPGPRPIFVCGMFRSGSTLFEQLLAGHAGVMAGGELELLPDRVVGELRPFPEGLAALTAAESARLAKIYLDGLRTLFPAARWVTDKRLDNFLYIGLIKTLFPDARIVHTTRDPLDNCLSIYFLHLDKRLNYASELLDIGHYYREYRRLMTHWQRSYGDDIIELNYDRFVREPLTVAPPVFERLGLQWDPRFLKEMADTGRSIRTASVWQVREPLYRRSSGRAQHYLGELAPLRELLAGLPS